LEQKLWSFEVLTKIKFATFLELSNLTKLKALDIFSTKYRLKEVTTKKIQPKITTLATKTKNPK